MAKIKCIKVDRGSGFGSYVTKDIETAIQELRDDYENGDMTTEGTLFFSIVEMEEIELEALPDFDGW
jgi:hypothetical protein